jgi:hypothetical protein
MTVHSEYIPEIRQMAERTLEMSRSEKGSSDARYSLATAYSYLLKAANALEVLSNYTASVN